jgi:DNA-binding PadR family transcriptional regulator
MGGDGIPRGRRLGSEELQLVILSLLSEQPAHGYEIMRALDERSGGFYSPSPGMVYPALTYLDELGHAAVTQEGHRKLYAITDFGRMHLQENSQQVTTILNTLKRIGSRMNEVREAYAGVSDVDPKAADELSNARHRLRHALMEKRGCGPDEVRRIAQILENAVSEISQDES